MAGPGPGPHERLHARQQRRTGRREVRRAGAGDDDGHRAGLKRGAAHLPAATRAAGGGHRGVRAPEKNQALIL